MAESLATEEEKKFFYKQVKIRTGHTKFVDPEYFKYPDGEDLFGKLRCSTKWAAVVSGLYGVLKSLTMAKKHTYKEWTFLLLKPVVPAVGMAAIFTTTTYMATNIRKKDDSYNYALGGAAAGVVFGAALKSKPHGVFGVVVFASLAMYLKELNLNVMKPSHRRDFTPFEARLLDFSFTPPKKGNWSKEKLPDQ